MRITNAFTLAQLYELAQSTTLYRPDEETYASFLRTVFSVELAKRICLKSSGDSYSSSQIWKIMNGDSYKNKEKTVQNYLSAHLSAEYHQVHSNWLALLSKCEPAVDAALWRCYRDEIVPKYSVEANGIRQTYQDIIRRYVLNVKWNETSRSELAELLTRLSLLAAGCVISVPKNDAELFPGQAPVEDTDSKEEAPDDASDELNAAFECFDNREYQEAYDKCLRLLRPGLEEAEPDAQRKGDLLYLLFLCVRTQKGLWVPDWVGMQEKQLLEETFVCGSPRMAERARRMYHSARGLFYTQQDYGECHRLCCMLWREYGRTLEGWGSERGDVLYLLERCHARKAELKIPGYLPQDSRELLALAARYGSREAEAILNPPFALRKLTRRNLLTGRKTEPEWYERGSLCVFNCVSSKAALFLETVPDDWAAAVKCAQPAGDLWERMESLGCVATSRRLFELIDPEKPRKFLLLSDDFRKNLYDTLEILEAVQEYRSVDDGERTGFPKLRIYVRGQYDVLAPQIDAMLNLMSSPVARVCILDDDKDASRVLSDYPLFYTIRGKKVREKKKLHYVIIGGTEAALWLARNAFWMMTFAEENITTAITVLSPESDRMEERFQSLCPAVIKENGVWERAKKGAPTFETTQLNAAVLEKKLETCKDACYFSVAAGSNEENEKLALWLREWTVRQAVIGAKARNLKKLHALPTVSFLCRDPYIAYLSKKLVVQSTELSSKAWYANYGLIPFGVDDERYTWDEIDGGIRAEQALCVHLQYAYAEPGADPSGEKRRSEEDEYYRRSYNRDSSLSVAEYLPYRLFQCVHPKTGSRILPENWDSTDGAAFTGETARKALATAFQSYLEVCSKEQRSELSKIEQLRWIRFMISRSWLPASIAEMEGYICQNNPRQQLYIARLHPCLVPDDKLDQVAEALEKVIGSRKDFHSSNRRTVEYTGEILEAKWGKEVQREREEQER